MKRACLALLMIAAIASPAAAMTLTSADIAPEAVIASAQIYPRCGGQNISPQLAWSGAPAGTKSLVLTMIDVAVKPANWSHWIVVDLPPQASGLPRGVTTLPGKASAVAGNFGQAAYEGPCPPVGTGVHRYEFTIWAMPTAKTAIAPNGRASEIAPLLAKTTLAHASFTGTVRR